MFQSRRNPSIGDRNQTNVSAGRAGEVSDVDPASHAAEIAPIPDDYWTLARQPWHSLLFLVPLLFGFEWIQRQQSNAGGTVTSNGVEAWLRHLLRSIELDAPFLLPGIVVLLLAGWHVSGRLMGRYRTTLRIDVLFGMAAESLLFCCVLIVIGQAQDLIFQEYVYRPELSVAGSPTLNLQAQFSSLVGAGIYEEVLFRLLLLPCLLGLLKILTLPRGIAAFFAICLTGVAFAFAHHLGPQPDPFLTLTFTFRVTAGLFLSTLFLWRGFGVTVGCHTAYDVVVGAIMQSQA